MILATKGREYFGDRVSITAIDICAASGPFY